MKLSLFKYFSIAAILLHTSYAGAVIWIQTETMAVEAQATLDANKIVHITGKGRIAPSPPFQDIRMITKARVSSSGVNEIEFWMIDNDNKDVAFKESPATSNELYSFPLADAENQIERRLKDIRDSIETFKEIADSMDSSTIYLREDSNKRYKKALESLAFSRKVIDFQIEDLTALLSALATLPYSVEKAQAELPNLRNLVTPVDEALAAKGIKL